ncbi:Phenylalanyl-tRNA synthetase class IIc alpha subunit [Klebsormidium nitens]|uniref:phenylalanine--tRNA ligase n=1 Tax=Klebsormidium nitens TaxID=105231 RepID=A0A1Y1IFG6_KLENI|nr:Phenylalanyl-tRNA synthetase class IIc alpha subunit [Klebsormidium nitens]|eukprot:GAQ88772.1 Phenylalanyl-tRNA synthetase class IIc alpha subunit [Klebsormidium nitens]
MAAAEDVEDQLLQQVDKQGEIEDSRKFAESIGVNHDKVLGDTIKSLLAYELITTKTVAHTRWELTAEGQQYAKDGTPEAQLFHAVPEQGTISREEIEAKLNKDLVTIGFNRAMKERWLEVEKEKKPEGAPEEKKEAKKEKGAKAPPKPQIVKRKVATIDDIVQKQLQSVAEGKELSEKDLKALQSRKLVELVTFKSFVISKGPKFALKRTKALTDMTKEMMDSKAWKGATFKDYNFAALGLPPSGGSLHPLLKVRAQFRKIFLQMGFEEMPTNNFVESSFWNFDALFQPQQHPARDSHDTFFLKAPEKCRSVPEDYMKRVKEMHEHGGGGSLGYGYDWQYSEAAKNLLRTHTTAVSSRMLYKLAQDGFKPKKYFSIDRVFRNEAVDRTHLAEFHQIEGLICDRGVTLGDLLGTIEQFFSRLGMNEIRFKPAFNPYTEPSAEIFGYHPQLKKWVELGNSGMFRPEMLQPMGLPPDVNVIAWGFGLERPTMILYNIDNIRDLFGHKVNLNVIRSNPICRLGY